MKQDPMTVVMLSDRGSVPIIYEFNKPSWQYPIRVRGRFPESAPIAAITLADDMIWTIDDMEPKMNFSSFADIFTFLYEDQHIVWFKVDGFASVVEPVDDAVLSPDERKRWK